MARTGGTRQASATNATEDGSQSDFLRLDGRDREEG
jgi:hypothetical protein